MTAEEVLAYFRLRPKSAKGCMAYLRRRGLRGTRLGAEFVYHRDAVEDFTRANTTSGLTRLSQCTRLLRMSGAKLRRGIENGTLPGLISADGQVFADPLAIREAMARKGSAND
jgi:hypothetical protein